MCQLLFELLQVAVGTRDSLTFRPSVDEWASVLNEAERQAIVSFLTYGLERLPKNQLPPKVMLLQWIGECHINESTSALHIRCVKELTKKFQDAGFKVCVLKGLSAAYRYPNPSYRQLGDIDLWVNGCRSDVMDWLRKQCNIGQEVWHHVGVKIYDDVPVEVHFHPIWLYNPVHNSRLQRWFSEQERVIFAKPVNVHGFVETNAVFDAVYQLTHCFHHLMEEGLGLRHIVDYYYVLKCLDDEERGLASGVLQSLGMMKFCAAVMWIIKYVMCIPDNELLCEPNEIEGRFVLKEIMAGGNFGHSRQDGLNRNSSARWRMMVTHYPNEVMWMIPWKLWHKYWRFVNK